MAHFCPAVPAPAGALRLAWLNLLRQPGHSAACALAATLAAAIAFQMILMGLGVHRSLAMGRARLGADLMVVPAGAARQARSALLVGEPHSFYMDAGIEHRVAAVAGIQATTPQVFLAALATPDCCTSPLFLVGFDPRTDFTIQPWLGAQLGRHLANDEILTGAQVLTPVGESMQFHGREFRVAGRLDTSGMGMDRSVFLTREAAAAIMSDIGALATQPLAVPPGGISAVMARLDHPEAGARMSQDIRDHVPGVAVVLPAQVVRDTAADLARLGSRSALAAGGLLALAPVLQAALLAAIVAERRRELAVLRALGASAAFVARLVLAESVLLGLGGGLAGVLTGGLLFPTFRQTLIAALHLPHAWLPPWQTGAVAAALVAGAALAGLAAAAFPAFQQATLDPHLSLQRQIG